MDTFSLFRKAALCALPLLLSALLSAQTNCDDRTTPINPAPPTGLTVQQIVEKFAAREAVFKQARNNYTYTQDVIVQTLEGNTPDGEFHQVWDITYDAKGARLENVTFA